MELREDVLIVGAGIAGLACARGLAAGAKPAVVLEKSRGVGGRCATRRIREQPVDHGVSFYHGSDAGFLAALSEVGGGGLIDGWPHNIVGEGKPCQPRAFAPDEKRMAFSDGITVFPKHLARGLDIRRETRVTRLVGRGDTLRIELENGGPLAARTVLLTAPLPQTCDLLRPLRDLPEVRSVLQLLEMFRVPCCLTLIAGYAPEPERIDWDVNYPEESRILQMVSHDSRKRRDPDFRVLVYQAQPGWSAHHRDSPERHWQGAVLEEARRLIGPWAASPEWVETHVWRYSRVDRDGELSRPLLLTLPDGTRVGVAGEIFASGGGVEAAWQSGSELARRTLGENA